MADHEDDNIVMIPYDDILQDTGDGGATLFVMGDDEVWIPNSISHRDIEWGQVGIPEWFAIKEGLV